MTSWTFVRKLVGLEVASCIENIAKARALASLSEMFLMSSSAASGLILAKLEGPLTAIDNAVGAS